MLIGGKFAAAVWSIPLKVPFISFPMNIIMRQLQIPQPTSPEFMVLEECWNISKRDLLVLAYYPSFDDFRKRVGKYIRTKRFNLNVRNYLLGNVS